MKLIDFYHKYGFNNAVSMMNAMLEKPVSGYSSSMRNQNMVRKNFVKFVKDNNMEFELPEESTLELMRQVNKMVKSDDCPSNRKNKFYMLKHRYIKTMLDDGKVEKILESENLYHFYIGEYSFHQFKTMFKNIKADGPEDYVKETLSVPFSDETFRKCAVRMVYDISVSRYNKYKAKKL